MFFFCSSLALEGYDWISYFYLSLMTRTHSLFRSWANINHTVPDGHENDNDDNIVQISVFFLVFGWWGFKWEKRTCLPSEICKLSGGSSKRKWRGLEDTQIAYRNYCLTCNCTHTQISTAALQIELVNRNYPVSRGKPNFASSKLQPTKQCVIQRFLSVEYCDIDKYFWIFDNSNFVYWTS